MHVGFKTHPGYLSVALTGVYSFKEMIRAIDSIARASRRRRRKRVLVEVAILGDAPILDRYRYAAHAARALRDLEKCAAYTGPQQRLEPFTADVAQTRGLWLEVFGNRRDGLKWLLFGAPPAPTGKACRL